MLPTLAAAVLLGALAPMLRALMMGVPLGLLSVGMALRSFASAVMTVVAFGALARVTLIFVIPATPPELGLYAAAVAFGVAAPLFVLSARRRRRLRGALLLAYRLKDESVREQALEALTRLVTRSRPKPGRPAMNHVQMVLMLAAPLTAFGLSDTLEEWLSASHTEGLDPRTSALRAQALATCRVEAGDVEGASRALDEVPERGVDPLLDSWLVATRALLHAVQGEPDAALRKLGDDDEDLEPALFASRSIVRAHVLASRGDEVGAEAELRRASEAAGVPALTRATRPEGPASDLARQLREEQEEVVPEDASDDDEDREDDESS